MPPPKPTKKAAAGDGDGAEDRLRTTEVVTLALTRELAQRTESVAIAESVAFQRTAETRLLATKLEEAQRDTADLAGEMERAHAEVEVSFLAKVAALEKTIAGLQLELAERDEAIETLRAQKDELGVRREQDLSRAQQRMEDMAIEFGDMLAETLQRMGQKMELTEAGGAASATAAATAVALALPAR